MEIRREFPRSVSYILLVTCVSNWKEGYDKAGCLEPKNLSQSDTASIPVCRCNPRMGYPRPFAVSAYGRGSQHESVNHCGSGRPHRGGRTCLWREASARTSFWKNDLQDKLGAQAGSYVLRWGESCDYAETPWSPRV